VIRPAVEADVPVLLQLVHELAVPATGEVWFGSSGSMAEMTDPPATARGWVTAFNAEDGQVRWKFKAPHPIVAGVTPTGGGLVFAADLSGELYAFDQKDGRVLWQTSTGEPVGGGLVVYQAGGHEFLGVASGMKSFAWPAAAQKSSVLVYGLP